MSTRKCHLWYCKSEHNVNISYHKLPLNDIMKNKWIKALGIEHLNIKSSFRVCSHHFEEDDFSGVKSNVLYPGVIPSRNIKIGYNTQQKNLDIEYIEDENDNVDTKPSQDKYYKRCIMPQCRDKNNEGVSFHRFPANPLMCEKWMRAFGLEQEEMRGYYRICSGHFDIYDFSDIRSNVLLPGAVPSKNLIALSSTIVMPTSRVQNLMQTNSEHQSILHYRKKTVSGKYYKKCNLPQCKGKSNNGISYHKLPVNERMRKKWIEVLGLQRDIGSAFRICSRHFHRCDFSVTKNNILLPGVLPSCNLK